MTTPASTAKPSAVSLDDVAYMVSWPRERLGDALAASRRAVAPNSRPGTVANPSPDLREDAAIARWIGAAARQLAMETRPVDVRATTVADLLVGGGPVLVALPPDREKPADRRLGRFLLILGLHRDGRVILLGPDLEARAYPDDLVAGWIFGVVDETGQGDELGAALDQLRLSSTGREKARRLLARARQEDRPACEGWVLEQGEATFWARVRAAGGRGLIGRMLIGHAAELVALVVSWWVIGLGALEGRLEVGWLWAWVLLLATLVSFRAMAGWAGGRLAITVGGLAKERLLEGILRLEPEEIRSRGVGQLLGSVLDAEALESLARAGGPLAAAALFEFLFGGVVVALGAAPALHLMLLAAWLAFAFALVLRFYRRVLDWAEARLSLTDELVENMVGYRTLMAQQPAARRNRGDDKAMATYERSARALDDESARLATLVPRGWLALGLLGLAPAFARGGTMPGSLAISLGGVLVVYLAFRKLADAAPALAAAAVAWRRTRPFFAAAGRQAALGSPAALVASAADEAAVGRRGLLVAREVVFRYPGRAEPVLKDCSFEVRRGERIVVDGASGAGKSTLGSLLCGLRRPESGVLLLGGFDHHSLRDERWRQRAGGVPQFHENHVLSASLLFNLLMGRRWPPRPEDFKEAEAVCRELGLGNLLDRMPAGLQQMVGDTGWQLSHGERSRLYIARSLLQNVDVRVLDESFASLDPETLDEVLDCVLRRTETLIVVAHA